MYIYYSSFSKYSIRKWGAQGIRQRSLGAVFTPNPYQMHLTIHSQIDCQKGSTIQPKSIPKQVTRKIMTIITNHVFLICKNMQIHRKGHSF